MLLKAAAGGGGKGMRLVERPTSSRTRSAMAAAEAEAAFGDATLYVEKALVPARHVEIQVLGDDQGNVLTLGERECSIQRRHQKLIEESPSPALTPEAREAMEPAAERACRAVGYRNAGTFEFLLGPDGELLLHRAERAPPGRASGHRARHRHRPRARAAAGRRGRGAHRDRAERRGAATRSRSASTPRIPRATSCPSPGRISAFEPPLGPGVRVDTFVESGVDDLAVLRLADRQAGRLGRRPPGGDRACRARARETIVEGVPTTRDLALEVLGSEPFRSGDYSTSTLEALRARWSHDHLPPAGAAGRRCSCSTSGTSRPGDRLAVRGRDRSVGARRRGGRGRSMRRSSTRASPRPPTAGRPTGSARSSAAPCASPCRARDRRGAGGGRDQRGRRVHEALRVRRRCAGS